MCLMERIIKYIKKAFLKFPKLRIIFLYSCQLGQNETRILKSKTYNETNHPCIECVKLMRHCFFKFRNQKRYFGF